MNQSQQSSLPTNNNNNDNNNNRHIVFSEPPRCDFYTIPSQTVNPVNYGYTQQPYAEPRFGWFRDFLRNIPQFASLVPAFFIFISGGISFSTSIGFAGGFIPGSHIQVCWFIAVIIGASISAVIVHKIPMRLIYIVASVLVIINGVVYTAKRYTYAVVLAARYCDGIAFGLTLIPTILNGSELTVKRFRGLNLSFEQISLVIGSLLSVAVAEIQLGGVCSIICGQLALVSAFIFTIESPVFFLRKNNENETVHVLRRLQKTKTITDETYALLNENKSLLEEDLARGISINFFNSLLPMVKVILFRCFVSMSSTILMNFVFAFATISYSMNELSNYFTYVYLLMSLIGCIISMYSLDTFGRRILSAIALIVGGGILITIGTLFVDMNSLIKYEIINSSDAFKVIYLLVIYRLVSGIMAPASTCYLSEAFSVSVKPYFILAAIFSENILQIIICLAIKRLSVSTFCFTLGAMQIVYGIVFYFIMPETKQTTLRNALKMFQSIIVLPKC